MREKKLGKVTDDWLIEVRGWLIPIKEYSGKAHEFDSDAYQQHTASPLLKKKVKNKSSKIKKGLSAKQKAMSTKYKFSELVEGRYDKQVSDLTKVIISAVKKKKKGFDKDLDILGHDVTLEVFIKYTKTKKAALPFAIQGETARLNFTFGRYLELGLQIAINTLLFTDETWNDFVAEVKEAVRHEIEHVTQHIMRKKPTTRKGTSDLPPMEYLLHRVEKPAFMAGFFTKAKTKKTTMDSIIDDFLEGYKDDLTTKQMKKVKAV